MGLYLLAASSLTTAHTYFANAADAALRLGIHQSVRTSSPNAESQHSCRKTYRILRAIHIYISSFLGLPCILPTTEAEMHQTAEGSNHQVGCDAKSEELAAKVNWRLFDVLNSGLRSTFFSGQAIDVGSTYRIPCFLMQEFGDSIDQWYQAATAVLHDEDTEVGNSSARYVVLQIYVFGRLMLAKSVAWLLTEYSYAYGRLVAYSPFVHHIASPNYGQLEGYATSLKSVEAAIDTVDSTRVLVYEERLYDLRPFVIHGTALAATVLLFVELLSIDYVGLENVAKASRAAEGLIADLVAQGVCPFERISCLQVGHCISEFWSGQHTDIDITAIILPAQKYGNNSVVLEVSAACQAF